MSAADMSRWLQAKGITRMVKLLVLGNSGVGKSFLCNVLLQQETFTHDYRSTSVTATTTFVAVVIDGVTYVVCNIPGLIEADESNIPRNKKAIVEAFAFEKGCPTLVLFVMGVSGGRPRNEDCVAALAVEQYVHLEPHATAVFVNNVNFGRLRGESPEAFRASVTLRVRQALSQPSLAVEVGAAVSEAAMRDYRSAEMMTLRAALMTAVRPREAVSMVPAPGAQLVLEKDRLEKVRAKVSELEAQEKREQAARAAKEEQHRQAVAAARQPVVVHQYDDSDDGCVVM